jgi:phosphoglycerate dehydrogenase-like enzyme
LLEEAGFEILEPPGGETLTREELHRYLPDCVASVAGGEALTADVLAHAPLLRVIARTGVGFDAVDLSACDRQGIVVTITPGVNQDAVAEQGFALLLAVVKRVPWNDRDVRAGGWDRTLVPPIRGMRLGLVGLGRIGRAMVPRAKAFAMDVVACDPIADSCVFEQCGVTCLSLDELLATSDAVSLHMPLSSETRHFMNRERFAKMKKGSYLINTSRGGLVDEGALREAIESGRIAGAGLDVLSSEPPSRDHPLLPLAQVVISPHIAGIDYKSMFDMAEMAARTIIELRNGHWPAECVVNSRLAPGWKW